MSFDVNSLGQPVGPAISNWHPPGYPLKSPREGLHCRVESLDPNRHALDLFAASQEDSTGKNWTYLPYGPFLQYEAYYRWLKEQHLSNETLFYAIVDLRTGKANGVASYLRMAPASGTIELGHLNFSPALQRTVAATEAMYLMISHVFDRGFRRLEWKCDTLNAPSRAAATRLGFSYEGTFRQATIVKGRNRDTAWYSIIDSEWPALQAAFVKWLVPENFDSSGRQKSRLSQLMQLTTGRCPKDAHQIEPENAATPD